MRRKNYIFMILTILWMLLIFSFSARNGDTSTEDSHRIGMFLGNTFVTDFSSWGKDRQLAFAQKIDFPIRKTAHATEYTVLAILLVCALYTGYLNKRRCCVFAWLVGVLYAATDEFHQLFVPGRSGRIIDVGIDSVGVSVGVLGCLFLIGFMHRKKSA